MCKVVSNKNKLNFINGLIMNKLKFLKSIVLIELYKFIYKVINAKQ